MGPTCPSCTLPLEGSLGYRILVAEPADEGGEPISLRVLYCGSCGAIVRTSLQGVRDPRTTDLTDPFGDQED
jgi:hypothetical protein